MVTVLYRAIKPVSMPQQEERAKEAGGKRRRGGSPMARPSSGCRGSAWLGPSSVAGTARGDGSCPGGSSRHQAPQILNKPQPSAVEAVEERSWGCWAARSGEGATQGGTGPSPSAAIRLRHSFSQTLGSACLFPSGTGAQCHGTPPQPCVQPAHPSLGHAAAAAQP